jgi:hypothetical protein
MKSLYREWMIRLQMFIAARETAPAIRPALRKAPQG